VASHGVGEYTAFVAKNGQGCQAGGDHCRLRHICIGQPLQWALGAQSGNRQTGDLIGESEQASGLCRALLHVGAHADGL